MTSLGKNVYYFYPCDDQYLVALPIPLIGLLNILSR